MQYSVSSLAIAALAILIAAAGLFFAYNAGYLDPIIEKIGVYVFKAKAKAEEKKMQAEGLRAGEDFLTSELKGNKQAEEVKLGVGSIGSLKKNL